MLKGVSIIVCCYNSSARLPQTLRYLSQQEFPTSIPVEIILVDNASTDHTKDVANQEWIKNGAPFSLKIISEPRAGLSYAREAGIENSTYEFIIFCDDDNWLSPNYIIDAYLIMHENRSIGVLGGRSEASSDTEIPFWFSSYQGSYAVGVQALNSGDISDRGYVWGAGMVFRKSIYLELLKNGFFHLLSDRTGASLTSGGDAEICYWFLLAGYKLWYDEKLSFIHCIPADRLKKKYLEKLHQGFEQSSSALQPYSVVLMKKKHEKSKLKIWLKFIFYLLRMLIFRRKEDKIYAEAFSPFNILLFCDVTFRIKQADAKMSPKYEYA